MLLCFWWWHRLPSWAPEFTPIFLWGSFYSIFSFMCMFCIYLSFCTFSLCCLFFFDLRILITPLISSRASYLLFYDSLNGVVYFVFHFMTVRTVWYILFFTLWQFERCGILCFSSYDSSNGVVYFVFHFYDSSNGVAYFSFHFMTVRTVWYILFFILWQFERGGLFCFSFL